MASDETISGKPRKCVACRKKTTKVLRRGLCPACAATAYRHVRSGKVTWDELIARGVATDSGRYTSPIGKVVQAVAEGR